MQKATYLQTKHHNRDLVLRTIFENESISRAEVARVTRLTRTTVSEVVNSLLKEGLVEEVGKGESIGGKSPILLSIVADSRYMIGLNLAQDKFVGAIVNLRGEIKEMVEVSVFDDDGQKALESVYQIINQLIRGNTSPSLGSVSAHPAWSSPAKASCSMRSTWTGRTCRSATCFRRNSNCRYRSSTTARRPPSVNMCMAARLNTEKT